MAARQTVFISYSHRDRVWHDRVLDHLGALSVEGSIDAWSDERIRTGTEWRKEIENALLSADAAILIVTRHFLSSPFIRKEEVTKLLKRRRDDGVLIYAVIAEPCLWNRFRWLESMQVVRIADLDKGQPSEYQIDQHLALLVQELDEALTLAGNGEDESADEEEEEEEAKTASDDVAALAPAEKEARIRWLLRQTPGESIDGLPEGLLKSITDVSQVKILEEYLEPTVETPTITNAINAISLLADWGWDHREIKTPTSIPKLRALYEAVDDVHIRKSILAALSKFSPSEIPFAFLIDRLATDAPVLKATILSDLQFYVNRPYLKPLFRKKLLPLLHEFCAYPQAECIYDDEFQSEMDFRFWVFRCLGRLHDESSAEVIDIFIENNTWPLDALAEAANAHWDITHTPKYVNILRKAKKQKVAGNTEHALKEVEKFLALKEKKKGAAAGKTKPIKNKAIRKAQISAKKKSARKSPKRKAGKKKTAKKKH